MKEEFDVDNTRLHPLSRDLEYIIDIDLFLFKGRPVNHDYDREVVVLINHGYAIGFSPNRYQPLWAAYRVVESDRDVDFDRPNLYYEDTRLNPEWGIGPETFGKQNDISYHVGHMVPNEVINRQFGRLAQMETSFMSNMSPQRGSLNTGIWKILEDKIRNIEDTDKRNHVWAIAGPIFSETPEVIERPNGSLVPITEAYYYITGDPFRYPWNRPSNVDIVCFRIPQDTTKDLPPDLSLYSPLEKYIVDLDVIEAQTRLSFFPHWEDNDDEAIPAFGLELPGARKKRRPPGTAYLPSFRSQIIPCILIKLYFCQGRKRMICS